MAEIGAEQLRARIAMRIREIATRRHLPISHLADQSGVSRAHLWAVLGGRRAPTSDVLSKLAHVLGVDPHELMRPSRKAASK